MALAHIGNRQSYEMAELLRELIRVFLLAV
jgi:hypothetical protein